MNSKIFLYLCITTLFAVLELTFFIIIYSLSFKKKKSFSIRLIISSTLSFVALLVVNYISYLIILHFNYSTESTQYVTFASSLINIIWLFLIYFALFDEKIDLILFAATLSKNTHLVFTSIQNAIVTSLNKYIFYTFIIDGFDYVSLIIYITFAILIGILSYFLIAKPFSKHKIANSKRTSIYITILFFITNIVILFFQCNIKIIASDNSNVVITFSIFESIFSLVLLIVLRFIIFWGEDIKEKNNLELFNEQQKKQNELIQRNMEAINIKVHDLKHHIGYMMQDKKIDKDFQKDIKEAIKIYDSYINTGNNTLDVVLKEKLLVCEVKNISFNIMLDGKELSFINNSDLISFFSNAIDNAIEAVEREDKENEYIKISSTRKENYLSITIQNYCSKNIVFSKDGTPITSKGDIQNHGYGTRSMKEIVKKYKGTITFQLSNSMFIVNALFFLPKKKEK